MRVVEHEGRPYFAMGYEEILEVLTQYAEQVMSTKAETLNVKLITSNDPTAMLYLVRGITFEEAAEMKKEGKAE